MQLLRYDLLPLEQVNFFVRSEFWDVFIYVKKILLFYWNELSKYAISDSKYRACKVRSVNHAIWKPFWQFEREFILLVTNWRYVVFYFCYCVWLEYKWSLSLKCSIIWRLCEPEVSEFTTVNTDSNLFSFEFLSLTNNDFAFYYLTYGELVGVALKFDVNFAAGPSFLLFGFHT